jgi:hypothetical protein
MSLHSPSERLLRDTLRRDSQSPSRSRSTPSPAKPRPHVVRHSTHPDYTAGSLLFRSAITPPTLHHDVKHNVPVNGCGCASRPPSPASSNAIDGAAELTPHEQVLKARLERVLRANSMEHVRKRRSSVDASERSSHASWPWHESSSKHLKTDATPAVLALATPSRSRSGSLCKDASQRLPTPPPTPPLPCHPGMFNARKASAHCRQMEGYVSFAAVEGLGEPPGNAGADEEDVPGSADTDATGTTSLGFARLLRVFGDVRGRLL